MSAEQRARELLRDHHALADGRHEKPLSQLNDAAGQARRAIGVADMWSSAMMAEPDRRVTGPVTVDTRHLGNPRLESISVEPGPWPDIGGYHYPPHAELPDWAHRGGKESQVQIDVPRGVTFDEAIDQRQPGESISDALNRRSEPRHREVVAQARGRGTIFHEAAHGDSAEDAGESADDRHLHGFQAHVRSRERADFYGVDPDNPPAAYVAEIAGRLGYDTPPPLWPPGVDLEREYRRIPSEQRAHHSQLLGVLWDEWNASGRTMHPTAFAEQWIAANPDHQAVAAWATGRDDPESSFRSIAADFRTVARKMGARGVGPVERPLDPRVNTDPQRKSDARQRARRFLK